MRLASQAEQGDIRGLGIFTKTQRLEASHAFPVERDQPNLVAREDRVTLDAVDGIMERLVLLGGEAHCIRSPWWSVVDVIAGIGAGGQHDA